jgi:hypothetical protein
MSTKIIDRLPSAPGTGTTKGNYTASGLGNDKGSIMFGHIHEKGDVTSGVMLRTPDGKILMDCTSFFSLSTTGTGSVIAKSCLNIYGSIIKGVSDAVTKKPSKNSNQKFWKQCNPNA